MAAIASRISRRRSRSSASANPSNGQSFLEHPLAEGSAKRTLAHEIDAYAEKRFEVRQKPAMVEQAAFGANSTRKSTSLCCRVSPRATEPNTRTFRAPHRSASCNFRCVAPATFPRDQGVGWLDRAFRRNLGRARSAGTSIHPGVLAVESRKSTNVLESVVCIALRCIHSMEPKRRQRRTGRPTWGKQAPKGQFIDGGNLGRP